MLRCTSKILINTINIDVNQKKYFLLFENNLYACSTACIEEYCNSHVKLRSKQTQKNNSILNLYM